MAEKQFMRISIGTRLGLTFSVLAVFVLLGNAIAVYELRQMWLEGQKVSDADAQVIAVLRVNKDVLQLHQDLQRSASNRDPLAFKGVLESSTETFGEDISRAREVLKTKPSPEKERALRTLETIEFSMVAQLSTLDALADNNDWLAIDRRLQLQLPNLSAISERLVKEMDDFGRAAQAEAERGIRTEMMQAIVTMLVTAGVLVLVAFLLGGKVTRDIAAPLDQLRKAAVALARGESVALRRTSNQVELNELAEAFQEMADRVRASYACLQESEALYRALTENASDVVLLIDCKGDIKYSSPSAERILRNGPHPLNRSSLIDIVDAMDRPLAKEMLERCLHSSPAEHTWELRFTTDHGTRILEIMATNLLQDPAVEGIVLNGRDITDRRAAEEALRRSETHLMQAQKMETVGRLAGGIAHDFNNLMGVIKGYTHLINAKLLPNSSIAEYTANIDKATVQAANLTRQLLSFSRNQNPTGEATELSKALSEQQDLLQRLIGEDIELSVTTAPGHFVVNMDPTQFQQVIINLGANARDAMPKGGRLEIALRREHIDPDTAATMGLETAGDYAFLTVKDTGGGIPQDVLPHIFEPFFTTKDPDKGTGLGLFMVYGIVRHASGTIFAHSDSSGSMFSIYLPEVASKPASQPATEKGVSVLSGRGAVLLVEDNEMLRNMVKSYLLSSGYQVHAVARPEDALNAVSGKIRRFQLLLTDILMPQMHGSDLAKKIRAIDPEIAVLFMSGYMPESGIDLSGVAGSDFIQKPFTLDEIHDKISTLLANRLSAKPAGKPATRSRRSFL
jgi:PAS domain S-box-containing protein